MEQVDLAQVGLPGIDGHPRAMLHGCAAMRVSLDTQAREQAK
jgi:hypothetical protein